MSHGYQVQQPAELDHYLKFWPKFLKDFSRFERLRKTIWIQHHQKTLPNIYNLNQNSALKIYPYPKAIPHFLK